MPIQAVDYIDTQRYPFEQADEARDALIADLRAELQANDCAVLKGFIRADVWGNWLPRATVWRFMATATSIGPTLTSRRTTRICRRATRCAVSTTARTPWFWLTILAPTVSCVRSTNGR